MSTAACEQECIERVMTLHWDITPCPCAVCAYGRARGWGAQVEYLPSAAADEDRVIRYARWDREVNRR